MSKSSSAKTAERAATEYSQLIEALDLPGLSLEAVRGDVGCTELSPTGEQDASSSEGEHAAHHEQTLVASSDNYIDSVVEFEHNLKGKEQSCCVRLLGKFKDKAKNLPGKVIESTKKVGRKLRAIIGCA